MFSAVTIFWLSTSLPSAMNEPSAVLNFRNVRSRRFDPQPTPALNQQLNRVTFNAGLNSELNERAVGCADAVEDFLNDAVLVGLRIDLEAVPDETLGVGIARGRELLHAVSFDIHLSPLQRQVIRQVRQLGEELQSVRVDHARTAAEWHQMARLAISIRLCDSRSRP
jgi:hypothetical protein